MSQTAPFLIRASALDQLADFAERSQVTVRNIDISAAKSATDVVEGMKSVLNIPDWCGSSWDSVADAFEEIRSEWPFPLILLVRGADDCWSKDPHLLLQTVIRLAELGQAFSSAGEQLLVVYVAHTWGEL